MRSRATISHQRMDLQDKDHRIESVVYQSSFWKLIFQWHLPLKIFQSPHRFFQLTSRRPRQLPSDVEFQCLRIQCRATTRLAAPSRVVLVDHAQWSRGLILIQFPGGEIVADTSSSIHTAIAAMKEKKNKIENRCVHGNWNGRIPSFYRAHIFGSTGSCNFNFFLGDKHLIHVRLDTMS